MAATHPTCTWRPCNNPVTQICCPTCNSNSNNNNNNSNNNNNKGVWLRDMTSTLPSPPLKTTTSITTEHVYLCAEHFIRHRALKKLPCFRKRFRMELLEVIGRCGGFIVMSEFNYNYMLVLLDCWFFDVCALTCFETTITGAIRSENSPVFCDL